MKISVSALLFLFLLLTMIPAFLSQSKVPEAINLPSACCLKYNEKVVPKKQVIRYKKALGCQLPAIIFITKRKQEVCANPNENWVQRYIKSIDQSSLPPKNLH